MPIQTDIIDGSEIIGSPLPEHRPPENPGQGDNSRNDVNRVQTRHAVVNTEENADIAIEFGGWLSVIFVVVIRSTGMRLLAGSMVFSAGVCFFANMTWIRFGPLITCCFVRFHASRNCFILDRDCVQHNRLLCRVFSAHFARVEHINLAADRTEKVSADGDRQSGKERCQMTFVRQFGNRAGSQKSNQQTASE